MNITYNKTAYIPTSKTILNELFVSVNDWAEGEGTICTNKDDVISAITEMTKEMKHEEYDELAEEVLAFLQEVIKNVTEDTSDIVFQS